MCWQPAGAGQKPTRTGSPTSGTMLVMLSKTGAQHLLQAFDQGTIGEGHFDIALRKWLTQKQEIVGASYLLPPMGNYTAHISGCEQAFATVPRESCWQENWCCPGTRVREDPKKRSKWFCKFSLSGSPAWIDDVNVDSGDELTWLSRYDVGDTAASSASASTDGQVPHVNRNTKKGITQGVSTARVVTESQPRPWTRLA